jgi:hypothetical protein
MNAKRFIVLAWIAILTLGLVNSVTPASAAPALPDEVVAAMTAGLMDEYNAYNTYAAIIAQFGAVRPFVNIQKAEARHITAWQTIFERYGVIVPERPDVTPLTFATFAAACDVAASAEIANFKLYDDMLKTLSAYPDMVQVVTALRNVSEFNPTPSPTLRARDW